MKEHVSLCDQATLSDRMDADSQQISNAASTSSQPVNSPPKKGLLASFVDKAKITDTQRKRLHVLLCLACITSGWSFRTVENPQFVNFLQNLRPNYKPPSTLFA